MNTLTPRTEKLRALFHEMYEFEDDGADPVHHALEKYSELETDLAAAQERIKALEGDAATGGAIGAAIQRAAGELPDYYEIEILVERGAGSVRLLLPDGDSLDMDVDADNRLAAEINAAIDASIAKEAGRG